ncbi:MAG: OmpH family outer membrane protein [Rhodobacteraceae bacterium]|nr:OmpH family outer membrane protein [Paracoccaceae bacterium]
MALLRTFAFALALALGGGSAVAQDAPRSVVNVPSPILTLDPDRVFAGSLWGKRVTAQINSELEALATENARMADELTVEERDLTDRRASLTPDEFRAAADAFDAKVSEIRRTQDAKSRDVARRADAEKLAFYQALFTPLSDVLKARGAVAILDRAAIFLAVDSIDVTDEVIARADALIGAGPAVDTPEAAPAPLATDPAAGN